MRQVARLHDGQRVVVVHADIWRGVIYRPWRWWSLADQVRQARWSRYKKRMF